MYFKKYGIMSEMSLGSFILEADDYLQNSRQKLKYFTGDPNALRREIVGDDYNNINDKNYGNNNVAAGNRHMEPMLLELLLLHVEMVKEWMESMPRFISWRSEQCRMVTKGIKILPWLFVTPSIMEHELSI